MGANCGGNNLEPRRKRSRPRHDPRSRHAAILFILRSPDRKTPKKFALTPRAVKFLLCKRKDQKIRPKSLQKPIKRLASGEGFIPEDPYRILARERSHEDARQTVATNRMLVQSLVIINCGR